MPYRAVQCRYVTYTTIHFYKNSTGKNLTQNFSLNTKVLIWRGLKMKILA